MKQKNYRSRLLILWAVIGLALILNGCDLLPRNPTPEPGTPTVEAETPVPTTDTPVPPTNTSVVGDATETPTETPVAEETPTEIPTETSASEETATATPPTDETATPTPAPDDGETGTILDLVSEDSRFTTLTKAIEAADLAETLDGDGPLTLFAPTDDAFDDLPEGSLESLLEDTSTLRGLLLHHVVEEELPASEVAERVTIITAQGRTVQVKVEGDTIFLNEAQIIEADIEASNGIIHVIDKILFPPGIGK